MAATGIKKLKGSHLMHLLDSTFGGETPSWFLIGKNIEDMSMDLGPDTATVKNILDETDVNDNGYEPSLSVETYYANTEDAIYEKIKSIALDRLVGDDCKSKYLEVLIDKTEGPYDAWMEDCIVKPQSYGGPQGGVNIPFNIQPCGNRIKGTVTIANKVVTFTPLAEG